jgi:threonine dehydratase
MELVSLADIRTAAADIAPTVLRTPLLPAGWDGELWLKPESLQPVGSFKLRGALHAIARLDLAERARGVVTHSSGNHGQALAYAARAAGVRCTVVVPEGAPAVKVDRIRALGPEVVLVAPPRRVPEAERIAAESGAVLVPPFDDRRIIAGQGTIGLEIVEDQPDLDTVVVPVGAVGSSGVDRGAAPVDRGDRVELLFAADAGLAGRREVVVWGERAPTAPRGRAPAAVADLAPAGTARRHRHGHRGEIRAAM